MKYTFLALFVASASAITHTPLYNEDVSVMQAMFDKFKVTYKRTYNSKEEEAQKFAIFVENMKVADARNIADANAGGTAVHGVTKFSDWTQEEFNTKILGPPETGPRVITGKYIGEDQIKDTTAAFMDWYIAGSVSDPKDLGECGCDWAMSAASQIESDYSIYEDIDVIEFSTQQIVSCCRANSNSCQTGHVEHGYVYVQRAGGIETALDYIYMNFLYNYTVTPCTQDSAEYVTGISGFNSLTSNETLLKSYMVNTGTFIGEFDATVWNSYTSGIIAACGDGSNIGYYAQVYAVQTGSGGYWRVRNWLGTDYGEDGSLRLQYGTNMCNITYNPTSTNILPL